MPGEHCGPPSIHRPRDPRRVAREYGVDFALGDTDSYHDMYFVGDSDRPDDPGDDRLRPAIGAHPAR